MLRSMSTYPVGMIGILSIEMVGNAGRLAA